eukprot:3101729-Pyramimonas_sp.AAC.1
MKPAGRQRDVFPLPPLALEGRAASCRSRRGQQWAQRGAARRRWANDGIAALNQLSGHGAGAAAPPGLTSSAARASALDHISQAFRDFP